MSIFDDLWGRVDAGLDTLGNTAGELWEAGKNAALDRINEQPANVTRPETIPDQNQPTTTQADPTYTNPVGQVWEQYKTPVMIVGGLVVAYVIYSAVSD